MDKQNKNAIDPKKLSEGYYHPNAIGKNKSHVHSLFLFSTKDPKKISEGYYHPNAFGKDKAHVHSLFPFSTNESNVPPPREKIIPSTPSNPGISTYSKRK